MFTEQLIGDPWPFICTYYLPSCLLLRSPFLSCSFPERQSEGKCERARPKMFFFAKNKPPWHLPCAFVDLFAGSYIWCFQMSNHLYVHTRVARCYIFRPKTAIWVKFGGSCNVKCWYILYIFDLFYAHLMLFYVHLVYFVVIWYMFPRFGILYQEKSGTPGSHCRSGENEVRLQKVTLIRASAHFLDFNWSQYFEMSTRIILGILQFSSFAHSQSKCFLLFHLRKTNWPSCTHELLLRCVCTYIAKAGPEYGLLII
jgi:hypothetical protein